MYEYTGQAEGNVGQENDRQTDQYPHRDNAWCLLHFLAVAPAATT